MKQKTNINAEDGKQELVITREFGRHTETKLLQIGMAQGMNMAHNRLQDIVNKLK
jgi:hypothetical protein